MNEKEFPVYRVSFGRRLLRIILRAVFKPIFRLLFRFEITGKENVPYGQPYMIASNHVSIFEPPFLMAFWPEFPEAIAGHDVWDRPGQAFFVKGYGAFPVKRGEYDREVIEKMLAVLRGGRPLLIYPEGGRSHTPQMRRALPGVSYLVDKAQVPILPVGFIGTRDDLLKDVFRFKRNLIQIKIGKPFELPPITERGEERRIARQRNSDLVMLKIGELLPDEYHGEYKGKISVK